MGIDMLAALREIGFSGSHQQGLRSNDRAETRSHRFEVHDFKSAKSAQRFVSVHRGVYNSFNVQRQLISRPTHGQFRTAAQQSWSNTTTAVTIPRQSRGLYFCEPLKAAGRGR